MEQKDIKIIGPDKNKVRFSDNVPVVSFQLSTQPSLAWIKIFDRISRTRPHSKKPRITVTGDCLEFLFTGNSSEDLQTILDLLNQDITEANREYYNVLLAEEQQSAEVQRKKAALGKEIKNSLDGLKYD